MENKTEFVRLVGDERRVGETLESVSRHWRSDKEKFLFVSPHDDDAVIGGGLLMQLAQREDVDIHLVIVTDGSMGYCSQKQKQTISEIRKNEAYKCYESVGIKSDNITWLGFPDCRLNEYLGRRSAGDESVSNIQGYTGLQNAFTYYIRKINPTQCFLPTSNDLHPDHKMVHQEFMISLFHSAGDIWPELGEPIKNVPYIHEMAVYCDFPYTPNLRMQAPQSYLQKKIEAIKAFESQKQIQAVVDIVCKSGAYEYLRAYDFKLYNPAAYYELFQKKHHIPFMH
jgi:LmbE family N-acetylglucosaminyl deacetylase